MARRLAQLWNRHRLIVLVFGASLALTVFFVVRMVVVTIHWSGLENRDLVIEGWMPIRYVARSWDVPPEVLGQALAQVPGARMTVADIATAQGTDVAAISAALMAAITVWRADDSDD